jgi:hypothetical protein
MCNLYSLTKGQAAIRDWFRAGHDHTGNLPLFPDQFAPVVRKSLRRSLSHFVRRPGFRPARLREVLP